MVSLEVAGPSKPRIVSLAPDQARNMAGWVLARCVNYDLGGFVTYGIGRMLNYISRPSTFLSLPFRKIFTALWYSAHKKLILV